MLVNKLNKPDRTQTQIAYGSIYLPYAEMEIESQRLVVWSRKIMLYKHQVESHLDQNMENLFYGVKVTKPTAWLIKWKYNAIPTQIEWERKTQGYILEINLRVVKDIGQIALFSF